MNDDNIPTVDLKAPLRIEESQNDLPESAPLDKKNKILFVLGSSYYVFIILITAAIGYLVFRLQK